MSNLIDAIQQNQTAQAYTANGAVTNQTSFSDCVDLFGVIGSSRGKDITNLFDKALSEDAEVAIRVAMWGRDVRGGAGERQTFRDLFSALVEKDYKVAGRVLQRIPELGRWDDVLVAIGTPLEPEAVELIRQGLNDPEVAGLCAKWMPRQGEVAAKIRKQLGMTPKGWRKTLVALSNTVEQKMCAGQWDAIEYGKLPSKAAAMYQNAFKRNDEQRYLSYVAALEKGEEKINAGAIFPHDVILSAKQGNAKVANEQWKVLPNYLEGDITNILPMVDVSFSMNCPAGQSKNVRCMDVAVGLGLYLAERTGGAFKDHFLTFSERPQLLTVQGSDLISRMNNMHKSNWGMNTNIQSAFDLILQSAVKNNLSQEDLPQMVLILSDMEFDRCGGRRTNFELIEQTFARAGYKRPQLVFWNLNGREGNMPVTIHDSGTALVSGFSPAIMKSLLAAKSMSPEQIMLDTVMIDRYNF